MILELTVVTGASAGHRQRYEQARVTIGRHPSSDLRFDADRELDVSAKHAEIRHDGGRWLLRDAGSTNGTFVNGRRAEGDTPLQEGDVVTFGVNGPQVMVHTGAAASRAPADGAPVLPSTRVSSAVDVPVSAGVSATGAAGALPARRRGGTALVGAAAAVVLALAAGAWWMASGGTAQPVVEQTGSTSAAASAPAAFETVSRRSGPAIAFMASELNGKPFGGTAFSVSESGLLVTNRHLVADGATRASRILVKFADTPTWLPARVVQVANGDDDLALLQIETPGSYPVVQGVAARAETPVGAAVATIGFPLGTDLPMDGTGDAAIARSTLTGGTVSKRLASLLQLDSFAGHGSSGSPVFDAAGNVVGVVWGGPRDSGGRIVYAIPSERVVALLPEGARGVVR